jgi:uncharacterized protein (TIGR02996 family)
MTDRDALLAAVRESPDDDLPRLIYADWLDEHSNALPEEERDSAGERAAFIRTQIEASRSEPFSPAARDAEERAAKVLTSRNREAWTWELRGLVLATQFERGFVHHATVDAAHFAETASDLFARESIRSLRLFRPPPSRAEYEVLLKPAFDVPELVQITALDLENLELVHADLMDLVESDSLRDLTRLSLRNNPIPPRWLEEVLLEGYWSDLQFLNLADIPHLGPTLARCLPTVDDAHQFIGLDLSGIAFRSNESKRVLESDCLSQLEELHLRWNGGASRPGSLTHLELSYVIPWESLRVLDLDGQGIGPEGVREIVRNSHAANLRWLGLARNYLGPEGVSLLCDDPDIFLYYLDVRSNDLKAKELAKLKARFPEARIVS